MTTPDQLHARAQDEARAKAASTKWATYSDDWYVEYNILHLQEITNNGLHPIYEENISSFLIDLIADFSWDRAHIQIDKLLNDPRYPHIATNFQEQHDCDLTHILGKISETTPPADQT